ncbi:MAG: VCBS repeat-containing protein [Syntrophaceae bacterium]|nr:VCBS repeat-containing protein [Syntrophaceae bacterium]
MMKHVRIVMLAVVLVVAAGLVWAKDTKTVAVLPFSVSSAENIDYVQQGIWNMLSSRLSSSGRIDVPGKEAVLGALGNKAGKELPMAELQALGKSLKADFVVAGSVTKIGGNLSIDAKLVDIATSKAAVGVFTSSKGMDEVIPKITEFAQKIETHVLGGAVAETTPLTPLPPTAVQPSGTSTRESEIIAGMRKGRTGTFTGAINPDFINAMQPVDRRGFWMSERFPLEFRGMDIGDVNRDGLNEIVAISRNEIRIFLKKGKEFRMLQKITGRSSDNYMSVDVADVNGNGVPEIIVTNAIENSVNSFVYEWKDGKFVQIASNLPWFFRVVNRHNPASQQLLGQRIRAMNISMDTNEFMPFDTPIHEIVWDGTRYTEGQRMKIPYGMSVFSLTIDDLGQGPTRVIALNQDDYLCIYQETEKSLTSLQKFGGASELLYRSDEPFGGSNLYVEAPSGTAVEAYLSKYWVNTRILTTDLNKDGRREILLVKNISASARVMRNVKLYTSSEFYNIEWDGLGMVENWRTRKINGYVADYQYKDVDNDGENEIVMALVLSTGMSFGETSVLAAYKMTPVATQIPKAEPTEGQR